MAKPKRTWKEGGRWVRQCYLCDEVKPLKTGYHRAHKKGRGPAAYGYGCRTCRSELGQERIRRQKATDPARRERLSEIFAASSKRWRERNPEKVRKSRQAYAEKVRCDPVLRARLAENARINYRLKREREGKPVGRGHAKVIKLECAPRLPAPPLASFITDYVERHQREMGLDPGEALSNELSYLGAETICRSLGISARQWRAWRNGTWVAVELGVADRVLVAAGASLPDVWPVEDYPEIYGIAA